MVVVHHFTSTEMCWLILACAGGPLLLLDVLRQKSERLNKFSIIMFGAVMRRREIHGLTGTTYLLIGAAVILALFPHPIVSLSLLFLALGDPAASLVGLKWGTIKIAGKNHGRIMTFGVCYLTAMFLSRTCLWWIIRHFAVVRARWVHFSSAFVQAR